MEFAEATGLSEMTRCCKLKQNLLHQCGQVLPSRSATRVTLLKHARVSSQGNIGAVALGHCCSYSRVRMHRRPKLRGSEWCMHSPCVQ